MSGKTYEPYSLRVIGLWVFLAPLIAILGMVDLVTNGRSRNWPFND